MSSGPRCWIPSSTWAARGPAACPRRRWRRPVTSTAAFRCVGARPAGVKQGPMPSTFRHAGEMMDEEVAVPRSRKGLIIGVVAAAAAAAAAAVFFLKQQSTEPVAAAVAAPAPAAAAPAPAPPEPAAPQVVKISFSSDPPGAAVVAKATGETLGTTPFEREFPQGKGRLGFVFKKATSRSRRARFVPETAGAVSASLQPSKARGADEDSHKPTAASSRSSSRGKRGKRQGPRSPTPSRAATSRSTTTPSSSPPSSSELRGARPARPTRTRGGRRVRRAAVVARRRRRGGRRGRRPRVAPTRGRRESPAGSGRGAPLRR